MQRSLEIIADARAAFDLVDPVPCRRRRAVVSTWGERSTADVWIDTIAAVLLALAAVATAWSSYQASRWTGEQSKAFAAASAARVESTRASSLANAQTSVDVGVFTQWVDAELRGEEDLSEFYEQRFRDEFQPAFRAWLATNPFDDPRLPRPRSRWRSTSWRRTRMRACSKPRPMRRPSLPERTCSGRRTTCSAWCCSRRPCSSLASVRGSGVRSSRSHPHRRMRGVHHGGVMDRHLPDQPVDLTPSAESTTD